MKLVDYLRLHIKSDEILELLEHFAMDVIYHFDRIHENTPDYYDSSAREAGFELRFDERQVLTSIFCYSQPFGEFKSIGGDIVGVPMFESVDAAKAHASKSNIKITEPLRDSKLSGAWIRLEHPQSWHHYGFTEKRLTLVTLMVPNVVA